MTYRELFRVAMGALWLIAYAAAALTRRRVRRHFRHATTRRGRGEWLVY